MLQLNYKLTDEDYIEFNEFHQLIHSEIGKRRTTICRRNNIKFYRRPDHRDNKRSGSESRL